MEHHSEKKSFPPFHPTLQGCVVRDQRFARALEESYLEELYAISAYVYRSLLTAGHNKALSELFEELAKDEMRHFRLLGELILALGGNPTICTQLRVGSPDGMGNSCAPTCRGTSRMVSDSLREEKRGIDRYQTLMGRTQDRVVRSVISHILSDEHRHVEELCAAEKLSYGK
ncbi:MAG: hypothetical protein IJW55_02265 [Clostridia bacterium]|nr:hypothetical protein [Clostridia bacterium]